MTLAATSSPSLVLGIPGFTFEDLHAPAGLERLFEAWRSDLTLRDPALAGRYDALRATRGAELKAEERSALDLELAATVSAWLARLFGVEPQLAHARAEVARELELLRFKDAFCKRRALKHKVTDAQAARAAGEARLRARGLDGAAQGDERQVAKVVLALVDRETELKQRPVDDPELVALRQELTAIEAWLAARKDELATRWLSLQFHETLPDALHLVELRRPQEAMPELVTGPHRRRRDGFRLTDRRMSPAEVMAEVDYCLYCHDRDKDSCTKGLKDQKGALKSNALGVELAGCPLDEKISEMHLMKRRGDSLAALALVCVDNPMLPGTGHRICNDCMKSCIYQKQEPVNIPQIETAVLTDVLAMPWGFEIYCLLTRWNPLNVRRPYPLPYRGQDVLVVGLGPAGYTLAHHLLNEGFGVVGIDGLKIEPLPQALLRPVRDFQPVELDERFLAGFGGVSEYGITARWDKNFLTVVYAALARRETFRVYGGVRFGGTLTLDDAWAQGFAHVAIAVGAGKPTIIEVKDNLIRGIRKASDFLMALQLTGAYKRTSPANLQVRLPALVIGGGLTAIDTATELLAYYVVQAEKTLDRHERLVADHGADRVRDLFDQEEREILDELLDHGRQLRVERERARAAGEAPDFGPLLDSWGGVAIAYRKKLTDSPAYRLNHEEVEKCLEEGVRFIEGMSPVQALSDEFGALRAMTFERQAVDVTGKWRSTGEMVELPARTLCVAAGTSPNIIYEKEHPGTFALDKKGFFAPHRAAAKNGQVALTPDPAGFFTSYVREGKTVSYYGDNHPRYAGSVVKAMASAKYGFLQVAELFGEPEPAEPAVQAAREAAFRERTAKLDEELCARVEEVRRLTPTIVEVVVKAPLAARRFRPGQFYRLQNFETLAPVVDGTRLTMEGLALTGASTLPERGLLSLIVLEMGGSSRLCAALAPGEPVVVMGPTGAPTEIPAGETVLLAGGGLGNAVLFSIGKALRAAGCRVLYFAGYRKREDVFKVDDIEAAADQIIWSVDAGPTIAIRRPQDLTFRGNVVQAILTYAEGRLGHVAMPLAEVKRVIAIGSDRMMRAVKDARHGVLAPHLDPSHVAVASINSPMQCMMKEICAQCLQKHVGPDGKETIVFSCFNQDQLMDRVDFTNLAARLRANSVQEKLTNLWFDKLLARRPDLRRV